MIVAQVTYQPLPRSIFIDTTKPIEDDSPLSSCPSPVTTPTKERAKAAVASDDNLPATGVPTPDIIPATESRPPSISIAGPRTRSRSRSKGPTPLMDGLVKARPNPPRLIQGTNSLATYHKNACTSFTSTPKDRHGEIDFVGQFIKGIQEPKTRSALVDELQKAHPCRTNKDGKVEVMCQWADVVEGLIKLGLLAVETERHLQSQGVRRKKKILIPKELIESGMMR